MNHLNDVEGMMTRPQRPFTLRHAMALVAATVIGLAIARGLHESIWSMTFRSFEAGSFSAISLEVARWITIAIPMAWAWTIALSLLSLRISPVGFRAHFILSGSAACGAATIAVAIEAINMLAILTVIVIRAGTTQPLDIGWMISGILTEMYVPNIGSPGLAVTVAWLTLAVSGRWRPEPSWIDRAGRLMGCGWIGLMMLHPWILLTLKGVLS